MVKDNWIPFPLKLLATKAATLALRAREEPLKIFAHLQRFDYYSCPKSRGKSIIIPTVSPLIYSNMSPQSLNSAVTLHNYTWHLNHKSFSPGMDQWEFSQTYNWSGAKRGFCLYKNITEMVSFEYKSNSSKAGSSDQERSTSLWSDLRAQCTCWKPIPEESFNTFYRKGHFPPQKRTFQEVFIMSLFFLILSGTSHWNCQVWASSVSARFFSSKGLPAFLKYLNILATLRSKGTTSSTI